MCKSDASCQGSQKRGEPAGLPRYPVLMVQPGSKTGRFASPTEIKKILISVNRTGSRLIVRFLGLGEPDRFWFCETLLHVRWRASIDLLVYMASD
jgi:hypothetical protein